MGTKELVRKNHLSLIFKESDMLQKVDLPVSDLFFMVDNSSYFEHLENDEDTANEALEDTANEALEDNAIQFCELMANMNINVDVQDIIADWHERV